MCQHDSKIDISSQRSAPPARDVMGYAAAGDNLTAVKGRESYAAFRHGTYYHVELRFDNDTLPAYPTVQVCTNVDPPVSVIVDDNDTAVEMRRAGDPPAS